MTDDLEGAYNAYQQALYHLKTPKDPNLWYAIGILYSKYNSNEHAKEAFIAALKIDPNFERKSEIYYRLAIIYKNQGLYDQSLEYLNSVLENPPPQIALTTIQYQIALVHILLGQLAQAKLIFENILRVDPRHAKSLQQMGWIHFKMQSSNESPNLDNAINYLLHSINADNTDSRTWYLLGRCYVLLQTYNKAYDAYKRAVYRDKTNPILWCSIGVMYSRMSQHQDALDAYSRAIYINPCLPKVWYNIGTSYENCNQISDALEAYVLAAELDPNHPHLHERITLLRTQQINPSSSSSSSASYLYPQEPSLLPSSFDNNIAAFSFPLLVFSSTTTPTISPIPQNKPQDAPNLSIQSSLPLFSSLLAGPSLLDQLNPFTAISVPSSSPSPLMKSNPTSSLSIITSTSTSSPTSLPFSNSTILPLSSTPHHLPTPIFRPQISPSSQIKPPSTASLCAGQASNNMAVPQNPLLFSNPLSSSSSGYKASPHNTKQSSSSRPFIQTSPTLKSNLTVTPLKLSSNSPLLTNLTISGSANLRNENIPSPKRLRPLFTSHSKSTLFIHPPIPLLKDSNPSSQTSNNNIIKTDNPNVTINNSDDSRTPYEDLAYSNSKEITNAELHCISPSEFENEQPSSKKQR